MGTIISLSEPEESTEHRIGLGIKKVMKVIIECNYCQSQRVTLFPPKRAGPLTWSKIKYRFNSSWTTEKGFWLLDESLFHFLTSGLLHLTSLFIKARSYHSPLTSTPALFSLLMHSPRNGQSASFTLCSKLFQMPLIFSFLSTIKTFLLSC